MGPKGKRMPGVKPVLGLVALGLMGGILCPPAALAMSEEAEALWAQHGPLEASLLMVRRSSSHLKGAADKGGVLALVEAERELVAAAWVALGAAAPGGRLDHQAYGRVVDTLDGVAPLFPTYLSYLLEVQPGGNRRPFLLNLRRHPRWVLEDHGQPEGWRAEPTPSGLRLVAN